MTAGITRLPQYYGPFRHPIAPSLTVTGLRLVATTDHAIGFPLLRALPLCACSRHYPGTASGCLFRSLRQTYQPSPHGWTGRPVQHHLDASHQQTATAMCCRQPNTLGVCPFKVRLISCFPNGILSCSLNVLGIPSPRLPMLGTGYARTSTEHGNKLDVQTAIYSLRYYVLGEPLG